MWRGSKGVKTTTVWFNLVLPPVATKGVCTVYALQAFGNGYYRGGFDPKMTKREAALVLGVRCVATF